MSIVEELRARRQEHVELIQDLVRAPSVSLEGQGLRDCADLVADHLERIGASDVRVVDVGDRYPGVYGFIDAGAPVTLLCYGHYDVRPVGTEEWHHDPFGADLGPADGYPEVIHGRGAAASKGPLQAFLNAVDTVRRVDGRLPVNLMFLIEGAEILGSLNYLKLMDEAGLDVSRISAVYGPSSSQDASGLVTLRLGFKGLVYMEITASGKSWGRGPQAEPVHSSTNAVVESPAWRLVQALGTLVDADGLPSSSKLRAAFTERKTLDVWETAELTRIGALAARDGVNSVIPGLSTGDPVLRFRGDADPEATVRQYMYGSSLNISGLRSGYTGPGTKSFLLPQTATATFDMRVITGEPAGQLVGAIRDQLDDAGYSDVEISVLGAYDWYQANLDDFIVSATLATLQQTGCNVEIWPMVAFGGPWAHVPKHLGVPGLLGGAPGYGARAATSDEYYVVAGDGAVADLETTEAFYADLLHALPRHFENGTSKGEVES